MPASKPPSPARLSPWQWLRAPAPPTDANPLAWHPSQLDACLESRGRSLPAPLAPAERDELRAAHRLWGADETAFAAIDRLADPAARVVVTGQQPALFAGPLLVLYKTLGAVALCRDLARRFPDLHFVPVFWVASEDHDFDEVRRVVWPGQAGALEACAMPASYADAGRIVGPRPVGDFLGELLGRIEATTPATEFRAAALELARRAYADPPGDLESGFCRLLLRLLHGMGLVIVSPSMRWLRRRALPILRAELANPGNSSRAVIDAGERLEREGAARFSARPLVRPPDSLNFFWLDDDRRRWSLRADGDAVQRLPVAGASDALPPLPRAEIAALLTSDPDRFSTNVVTRPLVQDAALPTVAQVVGPGEADYLAQVESVYETFGVFAPLRWPRPQALLLEPRIERRLEKYGLSANDAIENDADALVGILLRRAGEGSALGRAEQLLAQQLEQLEALKRELPADPALAAAVEKLALAMQKGYARLTERLTDRDRRAASQLQTDMQSVAAALRPAGLPQERALNPLVPFAVNYGPDWPVRLATMLSNDPSAPLQILRTADLAGQGSA